MAPRAVVCSSLIKVEERFTLKANRTETLACCFCRTVLSKLKKAELLFLNESKKGKIKVNSHILFLKLLNHLQFMMQTTGCVGAVAAAACSIV